MTQTLIFIESYFTTNFSDSSQYDEQVIDNNEKSLEEYCNNLPKLLEQFKNSTTLKKKLAKFHLNWKIIILLKFYLKEL